MERYTTILFDWDGCLADTLELWIDICSAALTKQGITATRQQIKEHHRCGEVAKAFGVSNMRVWDESVRDSALEHLINVKLYTGAQEILETLSWTRKLALISDSPREVILQNIEYHGLGEYFQVIITRDDIVHPKPDPEGVEKAITTLKADHEKTVMIGDSHKDIQAAQRAGIDSILMYPRSHRAFYSLKELLRHEPTHVIDDLSLLQHQLIL